MNIRKSSKLTLVYCALLAIFGCGGGGGETPGAATAALKVSVQGTLPAATLIGGIDVTINLPAGVTCSAATDGTTASGVVTASGLAVGGTPVAKFVAAAGSTPGQIRIGVIKADGFNVGEFATVNVNFTSDAPAASSFTVAGTPVMADLNGNTISGLTIQIH
jgi:hypothetical protein